MNFLKYGSSITNGRSCFLLLTSSINISIVGWALGFILLYRGIRNLLILEAFYNWIENFSLYGLRSMDANFSILRLHLKTHLGNFASTINRHFGASEFSSFIPTKLILWFFFIPQFICFQYLSCIISYIRKLSQLYYDYNSELFKNIHKSQELQPFMAVSHPQIRTSYTASVNTGIRHMLHSIHTTALNVLCV